MQRTWSCLRQENNMPETRGRLSWDHQPSSIASLIDFPLADMSARSLPLPFCLHSIPYWQSEFFERLSRRKTKGAGQSAGERLVDGGPAYRAACRGAAMSYTWAQGPSLTGRTACDRRYRCWTNPCDWQVTFVSLIHSHLHYTTMDDWMKKGIARRKDG